MNMRWILAVAALFLGLLAVNLIFPEPAYTRSARETGSVHLQTASRF